MIGYILVSSLGEFYVGITKDLKRRLGEHKFSGPMSKNEFSVFEKHKFSDRELASLWEIREIEARGIENILNVSLGGYGGRKMACSEQERKLLSEKAKKRYQDTKNREKTGKAVREAFSRSGARESLSKAVSIACARPEVVARRSASQKSSWADPEIRARRVRSLKVANSDPEKAEQRSLAAKKRWERRKLQA